LNFGLSYTYGYNYYRSYPAHSGSNWIFFYYSPMPRVGIQFNSNSWVEFDANSGVIAVTSVLTPRIHVVLTPKTNLSVFNEFVLLTPETNFGESELLSNRLGLLLSWNFSPKSWLYVAINDCREQDDGGELRQESSIGAIKVKYLIYF